MSLILLFRLRNREKNYVKMKKKWGEGAMIFYISAFTRNTLILLFEVMCRPGISSTCIFIDYSAQFLEFVLFVLVI